MRHLKSVSGIGILQVADKRTEGFAYQIEVWAGDNGHKEARGTLSGDIGALHSAFQVNDSILVFESGMTADISVTDHNGAGNASFIVQGRPQDWPF